MLSPVKWKAAAAFQQVKDQCQRDYNIISNPVAELLITR